MLVDTHCHLSSKKFYDDLDNVIERAINGGVGKIIMPSTSLKDAEEVVRLSRKHDELWGLVGIYPGQMQAFENNKLQISNSRQITIIKQQIDKLRELVKENREYIVGIGEIGLDVYWTGRQPEIENKMFESQMELAVEMDLPVMIHQRDTEKEIRKAMEQMSELPRGQFHCWSGSDEFLDYVLERGFYVGFCGNVTYKNNHKLREQAERVPKNRLLLETDSPYLPPAGHRGERNEPINVKITANVIAEARGITLGELGKITTENAIKLFGI